MSEFTAQRTHTAIKWTAARAQARSGDKPNPHFAPCVQGRSFIHEIALQASQRSVNTIRGDTKVLTGLN